MIHSVDSPRLLAEIDAMWGAEARGSGQWPVASALVNPKSRFPFCLEVNISGEAAKHGFAPEAIEPLLSELAGYRNVAIRGLMCMAGLEGGLDGGPARFRRAARTRDRLRPHCPPGVALDELSMGMSGDYEVAIEEGATIVRIGSALFEGVAGSL